MKFSKTLFFEIPSKDFIMPVYSEEDVNILKTFLQDDIIQFSIGLKSEEDDKGFYYIGQVKKFTEEFVLKDFSLVDRKRILDILNGFQKSPQNLFLNIETICISEIVYFKMTKNGLKAFIIHYSSENLLWLEKQGIEEYFIKEVSVLVSSNYRKKNEYSNDEVFYKIKNPNFK